MLDSKRRVKILDFGVAILARDEGQCAGVDPLMDFYLEKFPFLNDARHVRWMTAAAEDLENEGPFDVVFCINAFDPRHVSRVIRSMLAPGGHLVMSMNCHRTRFFRDYYSRLYRLVDRHHPHQFTPADIDVLWFPHAAAYHRDVLGGRSRKLKEFVRSAVNPAKWPMGLCKFAFDMTPHRKRPGQRSI